LLWLFVIIGLLTLWAVLLNVLSGTWRRAGGLARTVATLAMLGFAMGLGHGTALGWSCLLGAAVTELLARWPRSSEFARRALGTTQSGLAGARDSLRASVRGLRAPSARVRYAPDAPDSPRVESVALLRSAWEAGPDVFLASLRRAGRRDARLVTPPTQRWPARLEIGSESLEVWPVAAPAPRGWIDPALVQSWNWPQAAEAVMHHAAHVVFRTPLGAAEAARGHVVLHDQLHSALGEFSAIIALLWPAAGRLMPPAALTPLIEGDEMTLLAATCVNFRTFHLGPRPEDGCVCDSVGLHALGLSDFQAMTAAEPDERLAAALYWVVEQTLIGRRKLAEDDCITPPGGGRWRLQRGDARFDPRRTVLRLIEEPP
jgi:hypothetical protein